MASLITAFLEAAKNSRYDFVDELDDEQLKEVQPYVLIGMLYGASSNVEVVYLRANLCLNPYVFTLSKHPRLLLKLFMATVDGTYTGRLRFKQFTSNRRVNESIRAVCAHYNCQPDVAREYIEILGKKDVDSIVSNFKV